MRVSQDECIQCHGRWRPTSLESPSESLDPDGTFMGLPYWFCSVECYKKSVRKYLEDSRYDFDNALEDDKEYIEEIERLRNEYYTETTGGILANLFNPIARQSLSSYVHGKLENFVDLYRTRKKSAIVGAEIELDNRLAAEWAHERAEEEAAFEKERAKRLDKIKELMDEKSEREAAEAEFEEMLKAKPIPLQYRFDHTHIIGSSGQGKSTLICKQFFDDLRSPEGPALVVIDPKGTMVNELRTLDCFASASEMYTEGDWVFPHLLIIDPTLFPPALNLFAPPKRKYSAQLNEQMTNNTISLLQYVFSSKGSALTDKQMTCFSFAVALMFTIPSATIHTFLDLMNDPVLKTGGIPDTSKFKTCIDKLGATSKRFFYNSFYNQTEYGATKDQISSRIFGMLRYPAFDAMFSTNENKLDMFEYLQKGKVVLISSPKAVLGAEGSQLFSRYMVALTLQAAFERITVDRKTWHPAFLVIDEAQDVMDEVKTPELLEQAREFKLGVTLAHQNIKGQLSEALFSSISANTRIKYAGTRSSQDATVMARDMHCEPEFIMKQPIGSFACFVGGMTDHPFSLQLELGEIDTYKKMSDADFSLLCKCLDIELGVGKPKPHEGAAKAAPAATSPIAPQPKQASISLPLDYIPQQSSEDQLENKSDPSKPAKWTRGKL